MARIKKNYDKKSEPKRMKFIGIRLTQKEYGEILQMAELYAEGNVSFYIRSALKFYRPKSIMLEENY